MHNQWVFNQTKSLRIFLGLDVIHRMNAVITAANSIRWRWEVQNDWKFSIFNFTNFRKWIYCECDTFISTKVLKQIVYIPWKLFLELEAISLTHAHLPRFHFSINKELLVVRIRNCLFIVRPQLFPFRTVLRRPNFEMRIFFRLSLCMGMGLGIEEHYLKLCLFYLLLFATQSSNAVKETRNVRCSTGTPKKIGIQIHAPKITAHKSW